MTKKYPFTDLEIIRTKNFNLWQDWEKPIAGFFILAPNRDIKYIDEFTKEESYEFMDILIKTKKLMRQKLNIDSVYIYENESMDRFHLWIFPQLEWMKKFWEWIESVRPIMNYAKENMFTEKNIIEVKKYVEIMKENFNK